MKKESEEGGEQLEDENWKKQETRAGSSCTRLEQDPEAA